MLELGQPLHALTADACRGRSSYGARAKRASRPSTTSRRELHQEDVLITDDSGPIGLAGTMGGLTTEISDDSTEIVLEAAHFNPAAVARMSRRHGLGSEASKRFERGVDHELPAAASARAVELLAELGGRAWSAPASPSNG